jgi:hypothetical protein
MGRASKLPSSTRRRLSALVCLVALMLVNSQIAASAAMAITGTCCSGDQCPIHGNHHHPQKTDNPPMDCGHGEHNLSTIVNCSMSCCDNTEQPAVHGNLFLLTALSVSTSLTRLSEISFAHPTTNLSPAFAPLAPPPKSFLG